VLLGILDNQQSRFVSRQPDGHWKVLGGLEPSTQEFEWDSLLTGPSERSYVCRQSSEWWGRFTFYPIDSDTIQPAQFALPGDEQMYLNRWGRFFGGLILAWVAHVVVLIWGQQLCQSSTSEYAFGIDKVTLAPLGRRGCAFLLDATVILLLFAVSLTIHATILEVKWDRNPDRKISRALMHAEMNIDSWLNVGDCLSDPNEAFGRPRSSKQFFSLLLTVVIDTVLPLWLYRTYREGKTGRTFGKRLTGIQTVRLTLRPCGFARALVRSAMSLVDFTLLITPFPATISMMLSPYRQRIGDRIADTLVIQSR